MNHPSARVSELDSVRGLAAFAVVLHHVWETILPDQNTFPLAGYPVSGPVMLGKAAFWISVTPLRLAFSGHAAVGLFFVLSGFVLTKSLQSANQSGYLPFLVRRFFRIYPPFALVIVAAAALSWLLAPQAIPGHDWVNHYWRTPVTANLVLGHLTMIDTQGYYNSLDSSMWTLVHELRISCVFPLLVMLALRYPRGTLAGSALAFMMLSITHLTAALGGLAPAGLARQLLLSLIQTTRYVPFFVLGILAAIRHEAIEAWLMRCGRARKYLWAAALILLAVPYTKGYLEACYAIGSYLLLILTMHSPAARRLLRFPALQWLGKVSYSLYLVHLVVLLCAVYVLHDVLPMGVILPLAVVLSLLTADLLNRGVEMPSNRLGKWLAGRVAGPVGRIADRSPLRGMPE